MARMTDAPYAPFRMSTSGMAETPAFPDTEIERTRAGATALRRTVALARALASGGRSIDLAGLDGQVGLICARALDLPPEQGRTIREELEAVLAEVDDLAAALRLPLSAG